MPGSVHKTQESSAGRYCHLLFPADHLATDVQENYIEYHRQVFDSKGNFLHDVWLDWDGPKEPWLQLETFQRCS